MRASRRRSRLHRRGRGNGWCGKWGPVLVAHQSSWDAGGRCPAPSGSCVRNTRGMAIAETSFTLICCSAAILAQSSNSGAAFSTAARAAGDLEPDRAQPGRDGTSAATGIRAASSGSERRCVVSRKIPRPPPRAARRCHHGHQRARAVLLHVHARVEHLERPAAYNRSIQSGRRTAGSCRRSRIRDHDLIAHGFPRGLPPTTIRKTLGLPGRSREPAP